MMELYGKCWPRDFSKRFFIGMHMPDKDQNSSIPDVLKRTDVPDMIARLADTGCDALYFYMSCHMGNCYYPSREKYARVHSGMNGRDFLREATEACQRHEIALVAVYEFAHLQYIHTDQAPHDWRHYRHDEHGKEIPGRLCWNSGYGDFVAAQIEEVARQYPVAGFYVDMLDYPGLDLCPSCHKRFCAELHREPPVMPKDYMSAAHKEYRMWTFREAARYLNRLRTAVHKHIPGATVVNNYHALFCEDLYEIAAAVDYTTADPVPGYGSTLGLMEAAKRPHIFRCLMEGRPEKFDILFDPVTMGALQVMPVEPYLSVAATALANGGWPCLSSLWDRNGALNPPALEAARYVYKHVDRVAPWIGDGKSLKSAGVYISQETKFLFLSPGDRVDGKPQDVGPTIDLSGALMMLGAEHVPTDILTRRQLCRLADYRAVYLPNAICLSGMEVDALREYVRNGGTLLADGLTSLADEWGNLRDNFGLAEVFGVDFAGRTLDPYNAFQLCVKNPADYPFLGWENPSVSVNAPGVFVTLRKGACELATLHDRYRPSDRPGELFLLKNAFVVEEPLGPGIVENSFGKGRCIYFSANVFRAYASYQIPEIRKLAARWLVESEFNDAPVRAVAHACVKLSACERPDQGCWIVHLLNHQGIPNDSSHWIFKGLPLTEELVPVHDIRIVLNAPGRRIRRVRLITADMEVEARERDGRMEFTVLVLRAHEVAVIEFAEPWADTPEKVTRTDPLSMLHASDAVGTARPAQDKRSHDGWDGMGDGQL